MKQNLFSIKKITWSLMAYRNYPCSTVGQKEEEDVVYSMTQGDGKILKGCVTQGDGRMLKGCVTQGHGRMLKG